MQTLQLEQETCADLGTEACADLQLETTHNFLGPLGQQYLLSRFALQYGSFPKDANHC